MRKIDVVKLGREANRTVQLLRGAKIVSVHSIGADVYLVTDCPDADAEREPRVIKTVVASLQPRNSDRGGYSVESGEAIFIGSVILQPDKICIPYVVAVFEIVNGEI